LHTIGSRKMVPPKMLRMVPLGERYIAFRLELLHPRLVGRDGGAFDADAVPGDGVGRVHRDPVVGLVALLDAEVVILKLDVEIGQDQLFRGSIAK